MALATRRAFHRSRAADLWRHRDDTRPVTGTRFTNYRRRHGWRGAAHVAHAQDKQHEGERKDR